MKRILILIAITLCIFGTILWAVGGWAARLPYFLLQAIQSVPVSVLNRPAESRARSIFPIGVMEDGNIVDGNPLKFQAMLNDLQFHQFDSVMLDNNFSDRDAPLLNVSDKLGMNVYLLPAGDLNETWWSDSVPATIEAARNAAQPSVGQFSFHASFRGYVVADEPGLHDSTKVALMHQAFRELDPDHPAMPILIGVDRVGHLFNAAQPDVMLIDVYPIGYWNGSCDFSMNGFGYPNLDMVDYIRMVARSKPVEIPLWVILQTHKFGNGGAFSLREPTPTQVRIQQWIAIGEGATGIFWFIYSSQQGWTGLVDNPKLYGEVARLTQRLAQMRSLLLGVHKVEDKFTITGQHDPYVSTLASADSRRIFLVAVNRDCEKAQTLTINSTALKGQLRDVESSQRYAMNAPIAFQPGDGRMFEFVGMDTSFSTSQR